MIKLKPEINEPKYYIHIIIIALIVQQIMALFGYCAHALDLMLTIKLSIAIIVSDIFAHTLLGLS